MLRHILRLCCRWFPYVRIKAHQAENKSKIRAQEENVFDDEALIDDQIASCVGRDVNPRNSQVNQYCQENILHAN